MSKNGEKYGGSKKVNNSKHLKTKKEHKDRLIEQKPITKMSKPWLIASAVLIVVLIAALLFDEFYESTLITIDGKKYQMSDMTYYFYTVETQFDYYDQMFGGGGAYWDMSFDEASGTTMRDQAKQEAIDSVKYTEILYKEAIDEGYSLTEEEKETISGNVDTMLNEQLSPTVISRNNFSKAYLTEVLGKSTLVERYRQDKIDALDIDDEAIKAGIKFEDYRQYDIEYLYVSTKTTDEDGNYVDVSEEEKTAAYDKISGVFEAAKTTEDWSTLVPDDETQLTYQETNFVESGTTYSEEFEAMMMAMENGAVSEIYEDESGYYIVRMINNNSSESYDTAVEEAITSKENEEFNTIYEGILKQHKVKTNDKAIKKLKMGSLTI